MGRFIYEAKKSPTEIIKGVLVADNRSAAIQKIGQMGYYLVSIEEEMASLDTGRTTKKLIRRKVGLKHISNFTRQLSDLLEAGLTIVRALDILYNQTDNATLKAVIVDIRDYCVSGNPLSEALARHPAVFSDLYVSMIRSGEAGGALEKILKRLSDFGEKQLDLQTKIKTALAYPILMALVGIATIIILMTFVIPKMMVMFTDMGQSLPLPTQILVFVSNAFTRFWWIVIGLMVALFASLSRYYATSEGKYSIDDLKLKVPVMGLLIKRVEIARFARTLSTLLNNGVPILESLKVVSDTMENAVIKSDLEKAYAAVREGSSLARALSSSKVIPAAVMNIVSVGEESGNLEKSLLKVAEGYERESDEAIKIMMSLLEPVMILTLGAVVGFIVISMLLPIFEINFMMR